MCRGDGLSDPQSWLAEALTTRIHSLKRLDSVRGCDSGQETHLQGVDRMKKTPEILNKVADIVLAYKPKAKKPKRKKRSRKARK